MDILSSSPYSPSTPLSNRTKFYHNHRPLNSSPLAQDSGSPFSSPVAEAQARRQSQYKSRVPSTSRPRNDFRSSSAASATDPSSSVAPDSQKAILRERFKKRCLQRAEKARARARASKRRSDPSSDGFDEDMGGDLEETDDDIMQSEFYARIMLNQAHQERHAYRRSYYADVGSSIDPDMEDVTAWEDELRVPVPTESSSQQSAEEMTEVPELTPEELEQAELEAYAEEHERLAVLADFEDIPLDELFASDPELEENDRNRGGDVDMDMH